jgi:hypothetical protein
MKFGLPDIARGLVMQFAPQVIKGGMKEYIGNIKFKDAVTWVNEDKNLWDAIPPKFQNLINKYGPQLGQLDWLTVEWVIENTRATNPSLASLFLSWPEGREWLSKQLESIKKGETIKCQNQSC